MSLIPAKRFVVTSGLPGSGKTTIARALASLLHLPLIDKDDILERLYETRGIGDAAWRRLLSRDADTAARRFLKRPRHPGHLDASRSLDEIADSIRALARLAPLEIGTRVDVDTSVECDVPELARAISARWQTWIAGA